MAKKKKIEDNLVYSSYFWSFGTTSFRTKDFIYSIERLLELIEEFWKIPKNAGYGWEIINEEVEQKDIYEIKNRFYYFIRDNGFTEGDDKTPYKAAREKTSGLVDIGLINAERRLTDVGRRILFLSKNNDYSSDNPLGLAKDSYLYLKQLIKSYVKTKDFVVRPFVVLINMLTKLDKLTKEEFTYLAPLCISKDITDTITKEIKDVRNGTKTIDDLIVRALMGRPNYQAAYQVFMNEDLSEEVVMKIGMNRKSRKYDRPYYSLFLLLRDVFLYKNYDKVITLYLHTEKFKIVGGQWRKLLFKKSSKAAIKKAPTELLNDTAFSHVSTEEELKDVFFKMMHLIKAKETLQAYYDLNRRYLGLSNTLIFEDESVKLDIIPRHLFKMANSELYKLAYSETIYLTEDCSIETICPTLKFNEDAIVGSLNKELGIHLSTIKEAYRIVDNQRHDRFKKMVSSKFTDDTLLKLLADFDKRNDEEITNIVTDNADIPTIFEYVLAIIWYKISNYQGKILDYMKLSLDANLLPITHAAGGEADIVYEYSATKDYPAHTLLLEATLADSTNQRRMEMEPVSRHLGNHLLKTNNQLNYCVFAANYLHINVISDFRVRKVYTYYDSQDESRSIDGMKIIPLQTSDLRMIIMKHKCYPELYKKYDLAFQQDFSIKPKDWYESYVREGKSVTSLSQSKQLSQYAEEMMKFNNGISILSLQQACMKEFGEEYSLMEQRDWYNVVKSYLAEKSHRYNLRDDEEVTWMMAAESTEFAPTMVTDG